MSWIRGLLAGAWGVAHTVAVLVAKGWRTPPLYLFLLTFFLVVGAVLVLIGVDLGAADRWLDDQAGWLDRLGTLVFRAVFGLILIGCVVVIVLGVYQRFPSRGALRGT
jgi:hypothetical protein